MEKNQKQELHNPQGLRSIYVCHSSKRYGIAVGANHELEFHEYPKCIELWKKDGPEKKKVKRYNKRHILFVEYDDNPFMWVQPRPYLRAK